MSVAGAKCPYCDTISEFDILSLATLKHYGWMNCRNCGLFLKVLFEKPGLYDSKFEKYDSVVSFGELYSEHLAQYFSYSEPPIPEVFCQELKKIMRGIIVNFQSHPTNTKIRVIKNAEAEKWVVESLVPKIVPIYNNYPLQVKQIMDRLGFDTLLDPYTVVCEHCGVYIPKARQNNCPICLNGIMPPPP